MIRIVVVDDHPIVRQGLVATLDDEPDFEVVGAASSAEEALALVERQRPDVILLDLELPGMSGVEAIPRLREASPREQDPGLHRLRHRRARPERRPGRREAATSSRAPPSPRSPARSGPSRPAGPPWRRRPPRSSRTPSGRRAGPAR